MHIRILTSGVRRVHAGMARGTAIAPSSLAQAATYLGLISAMAADKQNTHAQISNAELGSSSARGLVSRASGFGY